MESLSKVIQVTPQSVRHGAADAPPVYVYTVALSPSWNVGYVPHGGYLLSVLTSAVQQHQALHDPAFAKHNHPAHLTSQFLTPSVSGAAEVEIKAASVTKNWTRLDVELWQSQPAPRSNASTETAAKRVLRISAHFLVTTLPPVPPPGPVADGLNSASPNIDYLDRPCPLLEHPGSIDMSDGGTPIPPKLILMPALRWKEVKIEKRSDGSLAWGGWMELQNGEDFRESAALIPFFADVAKTGAEMVPPGAAQSPNEIKGPFWFPTMTLSLDFKAPFPLLPSPSSSSTSAAPATRTFGIYSSTKSIRDGRHDLTTEVWSAPANLGEGGKPGDAERELDEGGVERWRREGSRLLGVSNQMALCVPVSVNMARAPKKEATQVSKL
ncbi:hypothetical protein JCM6882_007354 [Rhodosporidiobolus microsporus]